MPERISCDCVASPQRCDAAEPEVASMVCAGTLPASWANNTSLRSLDLSNNNFTGSLPQEWALLSQLRTLNVSHNSLSGAIPSSWHSGSMSSLTALCGPSPSSAHP